MTAKNDIAIQYVESIFSAASQYDVLATQLIKLCETIFTGTISFVGLENQRIYKIENDIITGYSPAFAGRVCLKLFISPISKLCDRKSFICTVSAQDIGCRELPIEGLALSDNLKIGYYFYITDSKTGIIEVSFDVPQGAKRIILSLRRFTKDTTDELIIEPYFQLLPETLMTLRKDLIKARGGLLSALRKPRKKQDAQNGQLKIQAMPFLYIADEFTEASFFSEVECYQLSRTDFLSQISSSKCSFIVLESAWEGNNGRWQGAMTYTDPTHVQRLALAAAIRAAKVKGMRIVFYNKEDPMHFEKYLPIATESDVILTSDEDCVAGYRQHFPEKEIHVLKFASSSNLCNPANMPEFSIRGSVAFAGSYYGASHDERVKQMEFILPVISEFNGVIFNRQSSRTDEKYQYPSEYQRFCQPAIKFTEMIKQYKNFKVFLNVNTITNSPTMLSRRVYELLSSGTPVISSPSKAIEAQFGNCVTIVESKSEAIEATRRLLEDKQYWMQTSHIGYRHVMNGNTYHDRLIQLMSIMNAEIQNEIHIPFVSLLIPTKAPGDYLRIIENVICQTHPKLELVIGFGFLWTDFDVRDFLRELETAIHCSEKKIYVRHIHFRERVSLGYKLNALVHEATGEIVAKMDDDDFYGRNYIADMLLPLRWGGYDFVGKKATYWKDIETGLFLLKHSKGSHCEADFIYGATFVTPRTILLANPFEDRLSGEDTFLLAKLKSAGYRIYAADPFGFCCFRRSTSHTWNLPDNFWKSDCEKMPSDFCIANIDI